MRKKTKPIEINMNIQLNEEAFDDVSENTRDVFIILINSELEKMANLLSRKASIWMIQLKHPNFWKKNGMD